MNIPAAYTELTDNVVWSIAENELGYEADRPINIGWMCSDRICRLGLAEKLALALGRLSRQRKALHV